MKINPEHDPLSDKWRPLEWCPLFGPLPVSGGPPSSILTRCSNIIYEARDIWNVPFRGGLLGHDCPTFTEISESLSDFTYLNHGFTKEKIASARGIFLHYDDAYSHCIIQDARKDYYTRADGTVKPVHSVISVLNDVIEDSRNMLYGTLRIWGFARAYDIQESIPDYAFVALFSISEAWFVLRSILDYGESEDDRFLRECLLEASELLDKARSMVATGTISELQPYAEERKKQKQINREKAKKTNDQRQHKRDLIVEAIKLEIKDILGKNKGLTNNGLVARILERRKQKPINPILAEMDYSTRHLLRLVKDIRLKDNPTP